MTYEAGQTLPDKLYFRIGEVSDIVGVKPYVLRYWETEFTDIRPTKSKSGQRLYRKKDVGLLLKIRELLYKERFTINGAKQRLKEVSKDGGTTETITATTTPPTTTTTATETLVAQETVVEAAPVVGETHELFPSEEKVETLTETATPAIKTTTTTTAPAPASKADLKFLQKLKTDLEWCLTEIRTN